MGKKLDQPDEASEAAHTAQADRLKAITEQAYADMGLECLGIRVNVKCISGYYGSWDQAKSDDLTVENTAATTTTSFQYQHAQIIWYMAPTFDQSDRDLYEIAVHELCHVLAAPVKDELMDAPNHEFYTEWVTRSLLSMKDAHERA